MESIDPSKFTLKQLRRLVELKKAQLASRNKRKPTMYDKFRRTYWSEVKDSEKYSHPQGYIQAMRDAKRHELYERWKSGKSGGK